MDRKDRGRCVRYRHPAGCGGAGARIISFIKKLSDSGTGSEKVGDGEQTEVNYDAVLVAGITRGLQAHDIEHMTLGMWVDYIIEWNEMHKDSSKVDKKTGEKVTSRKANQADFDAF